MTTEKRTFHIYDGKTWKPKGIYHSHTSRQSALKAASAGLKDILVREAHHNTYKKFTGKVVKNSCCLKLKLGNKYVTFKKIPKVHYVGTVNKH